MTHSDIEQTLKDIESVAVTEANAAEIYEIGSYGWLNENDVDDDNVGHAMWQLEPPLSHGMPPWWQQGWSFACALPGAWQLASEFTAVMFHQFGSDRLLLGSDGRHKIDKPSDLGRVVMAPVPLHQFRERQPAAFDMLTCLPQPRFAGFWQ